jgi:hypothetical protein
MENIRQTIAITAAVGICTAVCAMFVMCGLSRSDPQGPLLFIVGPFLSLWWGSTAAMLTMGSLFVRSRDREFRLPGAMLLIPGLLSLGWLLVGLFAR